MAAPFAILDPYRKAQCLLGASRHNEGNRLVYFDQGAADNSATPLVTLRLPVYIVIDCSGGMLHDLPLERFAAQAIQAVLEGDQRGPLTASIGLILFNDEATRSPLTPLPQFRLPDLQARGKTQLGRALVALNAALDADLVPQSPLDSTVPPWGRPIVFLISDGDPSLPEKVEWRPQAVALKQRATRRPFRTIALAVGSRVNDSVLRDFADDGAVIRVGTNMEELKNEIRRHIRWESEPE